MTAPRILLLPGWLGSGSEHWQRRWEALYGDTVVEQADWKTPRRGDWIVRLEEAILEEAGVIKPDDGGFEALIKKLLLKAKENPEARGAILAALAAAE